MLLVDFLDNRLPDFEEDRAKVDRDSTSRLSPYIHFGEVSVCCSALLAACAFIIRSSSRKTFIVKMHMAILLFCACRSCLSCRACHAELFKGLYFQQLVLQDACSVLLWCCKLWSACRCE